MGAVNEEGAVENPWRIVDDYKAERQDEVVRYEPAMGRPARFFIGSLLGPNYLDIDSLYLDAAMICAALRHSGFEIDAPAVGCEQPRFSAGWARWIKPVEQKRFWFAELEITIPQWVFTELLKRQGWRVCVTDE
jgi:hypothetical protein